MLCYILKCGLKYVSDYSMGAVECEYEGLQGTSELSRNYLNAFEKMMTRRRREVQKIDYYDADYVAKMNEYLNKRERYIYGEYAKVSPLTSYSDILEVPPESSIPAIGPKYENAINTYNSTYING